MSASKVAWAGLLGLVATVGAAWLFMQTAPETRIARAAAGMEVTPTSMQVFAPLIRRDVTPTALSTPTATPTLSPSPTATPPAGSNRSLRFYGNGVNAPGKDRVEIRIDGPARPADVGAGDFTLEFWMKAVLGENNNGHVCSAASDNWINGHIVIDRDVYGNGDYGDYGISLASGRIAFGVHNGSSGFTLCGTTNVADGQWHHIAVQRRRSDGYLWLFVDGQLQAQADGPNGDISYRDGRTGALKDPFLVLGAEKHDAGAAYPSYSGFMDELRISNVLRYSGNFVRPSGSFTPDANTVALYHFDEASGTTITDSSGATGGPSNGVMQVGGNPSGPVRSTDTPW
ncbi:MAG: LamG-like jellyroll fold domain-containing protein [Candidatus Brachytrichaceae bacterium NZ_4S206]|jgi:hypothetical protein